MRQGLTWYKREPRAFLEGCRASRLTERQVAVYSIVLDMIYDQGGETPDDPKHIASYLADTGAAAVRNTIEQLVSIGKLYRVGEMLHQRRAENEAETREKLSETRAESGRLGGVSSGNSRREANKIKDITEANALSKPEAEKRREEKKEEREAKASPKKSEKPDLMDIIRLKAGVRDDHQAWFGQAAAESVTIWMALGLTVAEIIETVGAWDRAGPPETPGALDGMMGARASEKRKPKPVVATKATSLTPEWFLPRKWGQWAFSEGMPIDEVRRQADIFRDYWLGIGTTAKGRKSDWEATWRNWIRKRLSEMPRGERNVTRSGEGQHLSQSAKRADPAAEQIARLARLGQTSGNGGGGDGGSGPEDGSIWLGEGPRHPG